MNPLNWILLGIAAGLAGGLAVREVQRARQGAPPPLPIIPPMAGLAPPPAYGGTSPAGQAPPLAGEPAAPQGPVEAPPILTTVDASPAPVPPTAGPPRFTPAVGDVIDVSKGRPIIDDEADDALVLGKLQGYGWTGEIIARRMEPYDRHIRSIVLRAGQGDLPVFWGDGVKTNPPTAATPPSPAAFTPGPTLVRPGYGSGKLVTDAGVNDILEVSVPESVSDDVNVRVIMDQLRSVGWTATVLDTVRQGFRPGYKIVRVVLRAGAGDIPVDWADGRSVVNLVRGPGPNPGGVIGPGLPLPTTIRGPNE